MEYSPQVQKICAQRWRACNLKRLREAQMVLQAKHRGLVASSPKAARMFLSD